MAGNSPASAGKWRWMPVYGGDALMVISVTLQHPKVSDSVLASEIQGEAGSIAGD